MTEFQSKIRMLRDECRQFNIYTLSCLEAFIYMGDGFTQQEIADRTMQAKPSVGKWMVWLELNGLIRVDSQPGKRRKPTSFTEDGLKFINNLKSIICPS